MPEGMLHGTALGANWGKMRFYLEPGHTAEHPRLRSGSVELPPAYEVGSFFSVQGQGETVA